MVSGSQRESLEIRGDRGSHRETEGVRRSQAESWVIRGRHREPPGVRNKKNRQICWDQESKILAVTAFLDGKMSPTGYFVHMAHVRMSVLPTQKLSSLIAYRFHGALVLFHCDDDATNGHRTDKMADIISSQYLMKKTVIEKGNGGTFSH